MSPAIRARYGARDKMHALLDWQGISGVPPPELLGLTDRPGSSGPSEEWWPSVGCGPLGSWWALWWTLPDTASERTGMARSEVALWPIDEIGQIDDLIPTMCELSGEAAILAPSQEFLRAVCDAMLDDDDRPPVVCGLEVWPGVIAAIWKKLWPSARQAFSARVALTPPQGGESVAPPRLFGIPSGRSQQWYGHRLVTDHSICSTSNCAVGYLIGCTDKYLDQVLAECPLSGPDMVVLKSLSRAADRLATMEVNPSAENAISLLRTLQMVMPEPHQAEVLKHKAAAVLSQQVPMADLSVVLSLANLKEDAFPENAVPAAITTWVKLNIVKSPISESARLIEKLKKDKAVQWWRDAVTAALAAVFGKVDKQWAVCVLQWLGMDECKDVLQQILPASNQTEDWLLRAASLVRMDDAGWKRLQSLTVNKDWSRLHACVLMQTVSEQQALSKQLDFAGTVLPGLEYLAEHLTGSVVIDGYLARPVGVLLKLVAKRTIQESSLLSGMDVGCLKWRQIWVAHINAGGAKWPSGVNKSEVSSRVVDVALKGENTDDLIRLISEDIAEVVITHALRKEFWRVLSGQAKQMVLNTVAQRLLAQLEQGVSVPEPEQELAAIIVALAGHRTLSPPAVLAIFSWSVSLSEREALSLLQSAQGSNWTTFAEPLGKAVAKRNWRTVAKEIYSLSKVAKPELHFAAVACRGLLSGWDGFWLSVRHGGVNPANNEHARQLELRLAELGAELAPDRLDDLWERRGGKRKDLPVGGTPASRWQAAARLANAGTFDGGLTALARELCNDFPYNQDLQELHAVFDRKSKHYEK